MPAAVLALVGRYRTALAAELGDRLRDVILFGSHARGQAHEESDIDVAVIVSDLDFSLHRHIIDVATDLGLEAGADLSPTVVDAATWETWKKQERPLARDVEREGIRP